MQRGVGVVDPGLVGGADGAALLVEEHHELGVGGLLGGARCVMRASRQVGRAG